MQKWIFVFILTAIFLVGSPCVFASPPKPPGNIAPGDYQRVNSYLKDLTAYWMDEESIAGLSIAVVNDNKLIFNEGFGLSDLESEKQVTEQTVYRVGAISGVFTASLILKLVELELIKLDDPITKYLPHLHFQYYDNKQYAITLENLLTHHAGLPMSRFEGSWTEQEKDLTALLDQLKGSYASYPPNKIYAYSNLAYSLLALIVEQVTGQSFIDAMQKHVLTPLKMFNTDIRYSKKIQANLATGYKKGEKLQLLFPRDIASLGIYTSVKDMSKLMQMLLQQSEESVISRASIKSMMSAHNNDVTLDLDKRIGFGVNIGGMNVVNGGPVVWRSGATLAFRSRMALLPKHNIAVVALSNESKAWRALEDISEKALQLMLQAKTGITQNLKAIKKEVVKNKYSFEDFSDNYTSFLGYIPIEKNNGKITASLLDWPLNVNSMNDGWYSLEYDLFGFIPINVSWLADIKIKPSIIENIYILIALYKGRQYLVGSHATLNKPGSTWVARQGEYQIINHDVLLKNMEIQNGTLKVLNDKLFFIYDIPNGYGQSLQIPIQTISNDKAIIPGLGTALNEMIQVKKFGNKEYLEYSGYLLEKIKEKESILDVF